jgi:hypothetical protein
MSLGGGTPVAVAQAQPYSQGIAVNATTLAWGLNAADQANDSVHAMPLAGGAVKTFMVGTTSGSTGIAMDSTTVYSSNWTDFTLTAFPLDGGTPIILASASWDLENGSYEAPIAVDATDVYWVDLGGLERVPKGGGAVTKLLSGICCGGSIALDSVNAYVTNPEGSGDVTMVPLDGSAATTLASGQDSPSRIAVDADNVYWTNSVWAGSVWRVPIAGGTPVRLASGQITPNGIAVDAKAVYWANQNGGTVMKLAK